MALTSAQEMVDRYIQAEKDVLEGRTVVIEGTTLSRENLDTITRNRTIWERRLMAERGGNGYKVARFIS